MAVILFHQKKRRSEKAATPVFIGINLNNC